jgi:hypothetical protein
VSLPFDFAQDIRKQPFTLSRSKGRTVHSAQALSKHERHTEYDFLRVHQVSFEKMPDLEVLAKEL